MYEIGMSCSAFPLIEESVRGLSDNGIRNIELCMSGGQYEACNFKEVMELSRRYQIRLWSCHLPFTPWGELDISSPDPERRKYTIAYYRDLMGKTSEIGVDKFVLHPSLEPIAPENREEMISCAMDSLQTLSDIAAGYGGVIAIENLPRTCLGNTADEMLRLVGADDKLRVCFDTNHLLQGDPIEFVHKLGSKIVTLHVSDYDFTDEQHWLPGEGLMNWPALLTALKEEGYHGVWMYELLMKPIQSRPRSRDLSFADFVRNAQELFAGAPLTVNA